MGRGGKGAGLKYLNGVGKPTCWMANMRRISYGDACA